MLIAIILVIIRNPSGYSAIFTSVYFTSRLKSKFFVSSKPNNFLIIKLFSTLTHYFFPLRFIVQFIIKAVAKQLSSNMGESRK